MEWTIGVGLEKKFTDREQTENRQRKDREFNYRGHSYPLWIVRVSGPIRKLAWLGKKWLNEKD